jgi:hypothetical protein
MTGAFHGHIPNISQMKVEELGHIWDRLNMLLLMLMMMMMMMATILQL